MTDQQISDRFASIQAKPTADGWNWEMSTEHYLKINDDDIRAAILYDEWFGFHATCNVFKKYLD